MANGKNTHTHTHTHTHIYIYKQLKSYFLILNHYSFYPIKMK